ncbi:hypothetical protein C8J56DRAFT_879521 [Mycena floridula]|nr:hypothetical protein C8J56DRAFT_879521 [Mycena floridula]
MTQLIGWHGLNFEILIVYHKHFQSPRLSELLLKEYLLWLRKAPKNGGDPLNESSWLFVPIPNLERQYFSFCYRKDFALGTVAHWTGSILAAIGNSTYEARMLRGPLRHWFVSTQSQRPFFLANSIKSLLHLDLHVLIFSRRHREDHDWRVSVPRLANSDPDTHPIPHWGTVTPKSLPFVKDSETWKCIQAWNCNCNHCAIHIKNYEFHENVSRM